MEVVRHTMEGESVYPDKTPKVMIGNASCYEFTEAEIRVLRLLLEGMTYRQMAEVLKVSPDCIKAAPCITDQKPEKGARSVKPAPALQTQSGKRAPGL